MEYILISSLGASSWGATDMNLSWPKMEKILYDNNYLDMFERFNTTQVAGSSTGQTLLNHQASLADGNFGFDMPRSIITNVAFNEGDTMMLDVEVKALGNGTNKFIGISC